MYNRYVQNDHGVYRRIPMPERPPCSDGPSAQPFPPQHGPDAAFPPPGSPTHENEHGDPCGRGDASVPHFPHEHPPRFLARVLDSLHLAQVDTADILLLLILFFLFEEQADDELLIALGLLLIL